MKLALLTVLRDKTTSQNAFRTASDKLSELLAAEAAEHIEMQSFVVETPISSTQGFKPIHPVVLIPILRAGIALLPAFMRIFNEAPIGFFGIRRDEVTTKPCLYYENLPFIGDHDQIIILDPMLATGGSTVLAIEKLVARGIGAQRITLVSIIAAPEGISRIKSAFPEVRLQIVAQDERLDEKKFIVPGLGDYGDRYFGIHFES
ncbi:MAG: uracil phosphoribosyltransferase [Chlamydiota bacterium]